MKCPLLLTQEKRQEMKLQGRGKISTSVETTRKAGKRK